MASTRLLSILLPALLLAAAVLAHDSNICDSPANTFYMDIFNEILHSHPEIASGLSPSPLIQGMDTSSPAYEFTGMGSGFSLTSMSNRIRELSCDHNEVTFSWRAFIRDSQSDGPLIELSYSGGIESGLAVYMVYMDAAANEIVIAYRHQGKLHAESVPIRLISGRWRDYSITLSGNLLSFHFDCQLVHQKLIPLPDYCSDESPVLLTVVNSVNGGIEFTGATGLYIYLQNLGIHFGPEGVKKQCPDVPQECPTCGQFLTVIEKLVTAEEENVLLQKKIDELESAGCSTTNTGGGGGSGVAPTSDTNCVLEIEGIQHSFKSGEFLVTSQSMVCFCNNGEDVCANLDDNSNVNFPTANCDATSTPTSATPTPTGINDPPVSTPGATCMFNDFGGREIPVGGILTMNEVDSCIVGTCSRSGFGLNLGRDSYECSEVSSNCSSLMEDIDKAVGICCGYCDSCDFTTCGDNAVCMLEDSPANKANCVCNNGYIFNITNHCVDINECLDATKCEDPNSFCVNTEGSFTCQCQEGYSLEVDTNNNNMCVDDDECRAETHNCSAFSICENIPGEFQCQCIANYTLDEEEGICVPVCESPCQNGGTCSGPNNCICTPEYTGLSCEVDIDECSSSSLNRCHGARLECVNTDGSYFCRCAKGFQERNSECQDVNECELKIHNCVGSSQCLNTPGSYRCLCTNRGGSEDCTGSCVRRGILYEDGAQFNDNCRSCTCLGGELTCRSIECDCNNPSSIPEGCCSQCNRRDCIIMDGLRIRPGSTWINPANRCERYDCLQNLTAVFVNLTESCPPLDCPVSVSTTPVGKCCPICMLPTCDASLDGESVSIRNKCETCVCENMKWNCTEKVTCPTYDCQPQDILFLRKGCCPVCRQTILGSPPQCLS